MNKVHQGLFLSTSNEVIWRQFVISKLPFGQINRYQALKVMIFLLRDPQGGVIGVEKLLI